MAEVMEERCSFFIRGFRWCASIAILFIFTYLVISPQDKYFTTECNKRLECYNACTKAFFPMLKCKQQPDAFYYGHNFYNNTYLFSRPDPLVWGAEALQDYEQCKSYILKNPEYETARSDTGLGRQVRTHTCFSFCASGEDEYMLGDDRK